MKFSIIMSVWQPWDYTRHALASLIPQIHKDWELILVADGEMSPVVDIFIRAFSHWPERRIVTVNSPRVEGIWGNRARRLGLDYCEGDYVCWVNHDNVVFPDYLSSHVRNIEKTPGCLSVVNLECWVKSRYYGIFPNGEPRLTKIDLMNFAMPLEIARQVDAFGPAMEKIHHADWISYEAASKLIPVERVAEDATPVGIHF
jgi:glycosyltransferase involved in cell wall biosynthesis